MSKSLSILLLSFIILTGAVWPVLAQPVFPWEAPSRTTYPGLQQLTFRDVINILNRLATWMFIILLSVAVIFIIVAAYNYLTAGGQAEKVSTVHKMLAYALVAIGIGLLAKGLIFLVAQLVGASTLPTF
jgi:uncharacterized membrane protein (DUF485 family)